MHDFYAVTHVTQRTHNLHLFSEWSTGFNISCVIQTLVKTTVDLGMRTCGFLKSNKGYYWKQELLCKQWKRHDIFILANDLYWSTVNVISFKCCYYNIAIFLSSIIKYYVFLFFRRVILYILCLISC